MCYLENSATNPAAENASEDVYDLLIFEYEREAIQIQIQFANIAFNNAFIQTPLDSIEDEGQPLESVQHMCGIHNAPISYVEASRNFNEPNPQSFPEDFVEACEIQTILRGEY